MIYHILNGPVLHTSPNIVRGTFSVVKRISPQTEGQHFFYINMFGAKMLYNNVDEEPYSKICKENGSEQYLINGSVLSFLKFMMSLKKEDKVIFHSNPQGRMSFFMNIFLLLRGRRYCNKISLICWGENDFLFNGNKLKHSIYRFIKSAVYSRYHQLCTLSLDDCRYVRTLYPKANTVYMPYIASEPIVYKWKSKIPHEKLKVMVSHSGWPHNEHIRSFSLLKKFVGSIEVLCPLCYGDEDYIKEVIDAGISIFGSDFHYFKELMPLQQYSELVQGQDVYMSSAKNQTGLGALFKALSGGAKIFVDGNVYSSLSEEGYLIFNVDDIINLSFSDFSSPLTREEAEANVKIRNKTIYDGEEIVSNWKNLYDYC